MKQEQWNFLKKAVRGESGAVVPVALIVDSPWIPGYLGISTVDYITIPDIWLAANLAVESRFPGAMFLPGFWVEPGMAAEPSAFGCRIAFHDNQPPAVHPLIEDIADVDRLVQPDPTVDGLMPVVLSLYRHVEPRVNDAGHRIKMVSARGPLALAAHLMGVTNFLIALKTEPEKTHKLLKMTSATVRSWLSAQAEVLHDVESYLVLDDVVGFLSKEDYLEFAHPYLKQVFSLPAELRLFHNDTDNPTCYEFLSDLGVDVFNFTHLRGIPEVRSLTGDRVCLMGNVPPLDVMVQGTAADTASRAEECIAQAGRGRFILSAGGGVSPGTPGDNIQALVKAAADSKRG
jgi:uroporphyrinogen-III decarboxylase